MAGCRVFTSTASSPVVWGWAARGPADVCVCVLEFMPCMGTYHPGGRAHCLGLAPHSRLSWDAPHSPLSAEPSRGAIQARQLPP